mgnify:FL=1
MDKKEGEEMDVTKKIKHLLLEKDVTATALAEKIGMTQSNISYKMTKNSYSIDDLKNIAAALDCELEINFVLPNGDKI